MDLVDGLVTVVCVPASGSMFAVGPATVRCSASDAHVNRAEASFDVVVTDTTPPILSGVPAAITAEATSAAGAVVQWAAPTAHDLVDAAVPVTCVPAPGSLFALGEKLVTCSATDAHGNRAERVVAVRVVDTTGPTSCCRRRPVRKPPVRSARS
jgi:hypothetical protein